MKRTLYITSLLFVISLLNQCAKEAAPTGGPKDFDPPMVLAEVPANHSINFASKKAKIYFDEFVSLKNLQEELLISPPFKRKPKFIVKGKRLIITFLDTLPKDKTVNLNFYNSIVDVNEANALKNYQYVFSTGPVIDTSFIDGRLLNARTGKPMEKELVFVYEKFNDSIVSQKLPSYIARTNKDGIFVVNNLGRGPYKLFALIDKNRTNLFDQPNEQIAFNTDSIYPSIEWTTMLDTIKLIDSIDVANKDTLYRDSLIVKKVQVSKLKPFQLRVFTEDFKKHYLSNSTRERKYLISLGFSRDIDTIGYKINLISPLSNKTQWYKEQMVGKDSALIWITDSTLYNTDSIYCSVTYPFTDTSDNVVFKTDSIYFLYDFGELANADTAMVLSNNLRKNKLDIDTLFEIKFSEPLLSYDSEKLYLKIKPDTAFIEHPYEIELADDKLSMIVKFKQDVLSSYIFIADSAAFKGIFNNVNDSLAMKYQYFQFEDYGNLIVNIDTVPKHSIFKLYNKSGKLVRSLKPARKGTIEFRQLPPNEYNLKVLIDANENGIWDTGNYYEKKQPELVIAFPGAIPIKKNWDTEQNWQLIRELKLYD
ncbi:MAG: hypothetical protein C0599_11140 [Salinivirgaceae bacterium]|nr:MAG: hypothetical protein C0599_11140 [Salinivirgaceae bacterium]